MYGMNVDPDNRYPERCKPGPIVSRQMTEEEVNKYGPPSESKPSNMLKQSDVARVLKNRKVRITYEVLLDECREKGTGPDAIKYIAETYKLSVNTIKSYICKWCIVEQLAS
jgi:hypothetical protein